MIQVESISIHEFRGIRNLSINFKNQNFAICGPNGTGKSGVVDALEFALTGNISRLSGRGTGDVSVKKHAPHVESRDRPDRARVILRGSIPKLKKTFTLERSIKTPSTPIIAPSDSDVHETLRQVSLHPEFALSRRELIRYVIAAPGDRAKEVQELLRLDEVEKVRTILQRIMNSSQREVAPLKREKDAARESLSRALEVADMNEEKLLAAANARRSVLGLGPITLLTPTTSLRDGLVAGPVPAPRSRIPKTQAVSDLRSLRELLALIAGPGTVTTCAKAIEKLTALSADPTASDGVARERFLQLALRFAEKDACPVCDTPWEITQLKELITEKLKHLDAVATRRAEIETIVEPLKANLVSLCDAILSITRHGALLGAEIDTRGLQDFRSELGLSSKALEEFVSVSACITALQDLTTIPSDVTETLTIIETRLAAIPEPSEVDAARDYLTVSQERLEAYRAVALRHKRATEHATLAKDIYTAYAEVSTSVLNEIYTEVEETFSELYRFINREDEEAFTAQLRPSIGKLGFDVDFYGRGMFPPGAYHSEGHQDGMGVCLYLALMSHLLGDGFVFAVLDDVLMSVDAGHRREICTLLKQRFPGTQFILTTHDDIWLRHMKTAGLIGSRASIQFRTWNVDQGPTEWDDRDVWDEIAEDLRRNDVRAAAALLRHYLEFLSAEICHRLRVPVEFRGDAQFQLGDLLPAATARFHSLLEKGRSVAESWGKEMEAEDIAEREARFTALVVASEVERWQINPAVHYNEWGNFQAKDFTPVVEAFRQLMQAFICANPDCGSYLYVVPERGPREVLRCNCNATNINLRKRKK